MNAVAAEAVGALTGIEAPPSAPIRTTTLVGIIQLVMTAYAIGAAALVLVFAARTVAFAGTWKESITAGPAQKLFGLIAFLILAVVAIALLGWFRSALR